MTTYLIIGEYSKAAFHSMLIDSSRPCDREASAKALFESIHIKLLNIFYSISSGSIICVVDSSAKKISEICMITMASGAFQKIHAEELITMREMNEVIKKSKKNLRECKSPINS
jgi:uncharacterized protein with GYD domain